MKVLGEKSKLIIIDIFNNLVIIFREGYVLCVNVKMSFTEYIEYIQVHTAQHIELENDVII